MNSVRSGPARRVVDIDWDLWRAHDPATIVFVVREGEVLLIRKKRGLGAGKINGPGGRIEPGESPRDCAIRETREEVGVTPLDLRKCGENRFQFVDGYSIHVHIFSAGRCDGNPVETAEAKPIWAPLEAIPYEEMWEDDRLWIPLLLRGVPFSGRFIFDGDIMLDHAIDLL